MTTEQYLEIKALVAELGYGDEFEWAQDLSLCDNADDFWTQYAWVVISSGLKNQAAQAVWQRIEVEVRAGRPGIEVFRHAGKVDAIERGFRERSEWLRMFLAAHDRLRFLESLPYIGKVTKFHLARDLGLDFAKPDRHLNRIARCVGLTAEALCGRISAETGDRIGAVDIVIWRAANLGLV